MMGDPFWTTADGETIIYPELEDDHLMNIWDSGYRNKWLLIEMIRRDFLNPKQVNGGKCKKCGKILISISLHDFRGCKHAFVDGGTDLFYHRSSMPETIKRLNKQEILQYLEGEK